MNKKPPLVVQILMLWGVVWLMHTSKTEITPLSLGISGTFVLYHNVTDPKRNKLVMQSRVSKHGIFRR